MTMTVKDLRIALADMPGDAQVILQGDEEGNRPSPLSDVETSIYLEDDDAVYDPRWTAREADMDPEDWETLKNENPRCVVLWP